MTKEQVLNAFNLFETKNVLIVGDVMIDTYIWGKVDRISPEAPVPIVSIKNRENRMGGSANVALNVKSIGATPIICSVVGNDEKGNLFFSLLEKRGMSKKGIIIEQNRQTTSKTRVISDNQHLLRVDEETTEYISKETEEQLLAEYKKILQTEKIDAVIFQDYNKGVLTPSFITRAIEEANANNIVTCVDPKKENFELYKNVTLFKPNFKELCEGTHSNLTKSDIDGIKNASLQLQKKLNSKNILITLSELGILISDGKEQFHTLSKAKDIVDVSGAGDTVIAVASLSISSGINNENTAKLSNIAGGLVCEKTGVVPVNKEELLIEFLKNI